MCIRDRWKSLPSPWLKAWPQLFNISMKPVKGYRYVKWPCQRLDAQLLLCKTVLNGPAPCVPYPSSDLWKWGHHIFFFSNISWTPWVLDPITNPYLGPRLGLPCYRLTSSFLDSFILDPRDIVSLLRACLLACSMSPHSQGKKRFTLWVLLLVTLSQRFKAAYHRHCGERKLCLTPASLNWDHEGIFGKPVSLKPSDHILLGRKQGFLLCFVFISKISYLYLNGVRTNTN